LALLNSFQAHTDAINRIKQSPFLNNTDYVSTCSYDRTVKIWYLSNPYNWSLIRNYTDHTQAVLGLEWINEDTIASGGYDYTIKIWSIKTAETKLTIYAGDVVYSLKLLTNGFYLASGLGSGKINIYDIINNGSLISILVGHTVDVKDLILLSNDLLASSSSDYTIRIWNLTTNSPKFILQGHSLNVNGLKLVSYDILASGSSDYSIKLWNITNGKLIRTLTGHSYYILNSVDFLSNSQILVSGSYWDQTIKIWNITTGQCLNTLNTGLNIYSLSVLNSIGRTSKYRFFFYFYSSSLSLSLTLLEQSSKFIFYFLYLALECPTTTTTTTTTTTSFSSTLTPQLTYLSSTTLTSSTPITTPKTNYGTKQSKKKSHND
jgi:WD40 repeat protein